jgi:hypothetical protein
MVLKITTRKQPGVGAQEVLELGRAGLAGLIEPVLLVSGRWLALVSHLLPGFAFSPLLDAAELMLPEALERLGCIILDPLQCGAVLSRAREKD